MAPIITRQEIFEVWSTNIKFERCTAVYEFVLRKFDTVVLSDEVIKELKTLLRSLCQQIELKWEKCHRTRDRFLKNNLDWLKEIVTFPEILYSSLPSTSREKSSSVLGRPSKPFAECCEKIKKRKIKTFVATTSPEKIFMAAEIKLREEGKKDSATIVKELSQASPTRGTKIKKSRLLFSEQQKTLSADQALAVMIDANLSTHQYAVIREQANNVVPHMYPSYNAVKEAKKRCYPEDIKVTEISAEIPLQSLINHTILRLCAAQEEVIEHIEDTFKEFYFIIKWGCDGSQQTRYKQRFTIEGQSDESLFSISMVPIQLYFNEDGSKRIIWQNPSPSSVRYCRPIEFIFAKETTDLVLRKVNAVEQQVKTLVPTCVVLGNKNVLVKSVLVLTMVDGKICTSLSSYSSSQTCFLCGATPKDMNKPDVILKKEVDIKALTFGLSPLHAWIRCMECLLHIAYRLDVKVWRAQGDEIQTKVANRKRYIQDRFKTEMGLLVDMPTQQAGNTNDGNTARRFFRNSEKSAHITGINLELIQRFHTILETINCGFAINADAFENYICQTRDLYFKEYYWFYMPSSVHKILFHSKIIIASCILPIVQLSEEAQEARNKDNRRYREHFTRKTSRVDTNTDLIHRLLISSDPFLSNLRHAPKRKQGKLSREVLSLLSVPNLDLEVSDSTETELEFIVLNILNLTYIL